MKKTQNIYEKNGITIETGGGPRTFKLVQEPEQVGIYELNSAGSYSHFSGGPQQGRIDSLRGEERKKLLRYLVLKAIDGKRPAPPLSYTKISPQLSNVASLDRTTHVDDEEVHTPFREKLRTFCNERHGQHLMRLLKRSPIERDFANAYLRYLNIFSEEPTLGESALDVIANEGYDTMMFWSFAPYLYDELKKRGIDLKESVRKILEWGSYGVSNETRTKGTDWNVVHLPGLISFKPWILDEDPEHISHQFTVQEAARVADLLIEIT